METEKLPKHHYVPVFYLKQWAKADGRLIEFSRPSGRVEARPCGPRGTGYKRGLYRLHSLPEHEAEQIETRFLRQVDNVSSDALQILLGKAPSKWTPNLRSGWTRFMLGALLRTPENIARMKYKLEDSGLQAFDSLVKDGGDPDKALDYLIHVTEASTFNLLMKVIDNTNIGPYFNAMRWFVINTKAANRTLFTSDRPIVMTNGMSKPESHLAIPISPHHAFFACNTLQTERQLKNIKLPALVKEMNRHIVQRAVKYVWNRETEQIDYVRKHMSSHAYLDRDFTESSVAKAL